MRLGAAVLRGTDVIGRVHSLANHSAVVVTLADPGCKLSVRLQDSGAVGVLQGRVGQTWHDAPVCLIDFLPRDEPYRSGDRVVTSGLSEAIPPGLRVGHVTKWEGEQTAMIVKASYAQVKMRPSAGFNDFRYVAVLNVVE